MTGKRVFQTGRALTDIISYCHHVSLTAFYGLKILVHFIQIVLPLFDQ